jgi:hypothetical protein
MHGMSSGGLGTDVIMSTGAIVVKLLELLNTSFLGITKFSDGNRIEDEIVQKLKMGIRPKLGWILICEEP